MFSWILNINEKLIKNIIKRNSMTKPSLEKFMKNKNLYFNFRDFFLENPILENVLLLLNISQFIILEIDFADLTTI